MQDGGARIAMLPETDLQHKYANYPSARLPHFVVLNCLKHSEVASSMNVEDESYSWTSGQGYNLFHRFKEVDLFPFMHAPQWDPGRIRGEPLA